MFFELPLQHLARWHLVMLRQKLSQVQHLCQMTSCLHALLVFLPSCTMKLSQMVKNAAVHPVFDQPKRARHSAAHWPPLAARKPNSDNQYFPTKWLLDLAHLPKLSYTGLCSYLPTAFLQRRLSGTAVHTQGNQSPDYSHMWLPSDGTSYQILSEQESLEDSSPLRARPLLTPLTP